ncbi:TPA: hypothetical protein QCI26_004701 [Enterobacter soli]|nr:hypothetical protein [Enterobacter soli]
MAKHFGYLTVMGCRDTPSNGWAPIVFYTVKSVCQNAVHRYIIQRITFYRFTLFSYQRSAMPFYKLIPAIHRHQQCVTIVSSDG